MIRTSFFKINHYFPYLIIGLLLSVVFTAIFIFVDSNLYNKVLAEDFIEHSFDYENEFQTRILEIHSEQREGYKYSFDNKDFRAIVIDKYLEIHESPLFGLGDVFVEKCVEYGAPQDCTILIGIAHYETELCKYGPSQLQQNCWGWGGAGENRVIFSSYEEAIDTVTSRLVTGYGEEFMTNPEFAEMTYCGPRPSCAVWGEAVQQFMNRLNNLSIQMGYRPLYSLR